MLNSQIGVAEQAYNMDASEVQINEGDPHL